MIVGFTGTQRGLSMRQVATLSDVLGVLQPTEVHHGDCIGADVEFHELVRLRLPKARVVIHPPINSSKRAFCKADSVFAEAPYLDRNHHIVDAAGVLVACPREAAEVLRSGTWATVRYARRHGVPVHLVFPDGSVVAPGGGVS